MTVNEPSALIRPVQNQGLIFDEQFRVEYFLTFNCLEGILI
jgi:hypothetical protein